MRAYSRDLRQKVVDAYDRGVGSQRQIAETFGVSRSFVEKLLQRRRTTGNIAPLPHGGGVKPVLDDEALALVRQLVKEEPDATLEELCEAVNRQRGVRVSVSNMCTRLKHIGLPRKKSTPRYRTRQSSGKASSAGVQSYYLRD